MLLLLLLSCPILLVSAVEAMAEEVEGVVDVEGEVGVEDELVGMRIHQSRLRRKP